MMMRKQVKKEVNTDVTSFSTEAETNEDENEKKLSEIKEKEILQPINEELLNNTLSTIVLRSMQRIPYIELCKQVFTTFLYFCFQVSSSKIIS